MTDDTDDLPDIETEPYTDAEWIEIEGATIGFPKGLGWFSETVGACAAVKVHLDKSGKIECLMQSGDNDEIFVWRDVTKLGRNNTLTAITAAKKQDKL